MKRARATIGIDVGGTKTLFALFDDSFKLIDKLKIKTPLAKGEKGFTEALLDGAKEFARMAEKKDLALLGVGVGAGGFCVETDGAEGFFAMTGGVVEQAVIKNVIPMPSRLAELNFICIV